MEHPPPSYRNKHRKAELPTARKMNPQDRRQGDAQPTIFLHLSPRRNIAEILQLHGNSICREEIAVAQTQH